MLFDLPLVVEPEIADEADRDVKDEVRRSSSAPDVGAEQIELPEADDATAAGEERVEHLAESLTRRRFMAGIFDTGVSGLALALLLAGAAALGAPAMLGDWPAYLLTVLEFSFVYVVFSLTFWGKTPGMVRAHLKVGRESDGQPGARRAMLRWLGGVATVLLLGLPTLALLRGRRPLADLLSDTHLEIS